MLLKKPILALAVLFVLCPALYTGQEKAATTTRQDLQYEMRSDLKRLVAIYRDSSGLCHLGYLDANGNFTEDFRYSPKKPGFVPFTMPSVHHINLISAAWFLKEREPVYEFRSGTLIKGHLDLRANFVPEVGSKIISMNDYRYSKDAPRIYNLPGEFVEMK